MAPQSPDLIKAVGHPLRRRLLSTFLGGAAGEGLSARYLAAIHGRSVRQVDYHLKALANGDILRPRLGRGKGGTAEVSYGMAPGVEEVWIHLVIEAMRGGSGP